MRLGKKNLSSPPNPKPNGKAKQKPAPKPSGSRTFRLADRVSRWLALGLVFVATVLLVTPSLFRRPVKYTPRAPAPEEIHARISFSVPDEEAKDRMIREKRSRAPYFYTHEIAALQRARKKAEDLFQKAGDLVQSRADTTTEALSLELVDYAQGKLGIPLDRDMAAIVLACAEDRNLLTKIQTCLEHLYQDRGIIDDLARYRSYENEGRVAISTPPRQRPQNRIVARNLLQPAQVKDYLDEEYFTQQLFYSVLPPDQVRLLSYLVPILAAKPNIAFDPDTTQESLKDQIAYIQNHPPLKSYHKDAILFEKNQPIDIALLERMDAADARMTYRRMAAIALYIAFLFSLVFYYIRQFRPDINFTTRNVLLVASPVVVALIFGRILLETVRSPMAAAYAFPAGLTGMLAVIVLDARLGILLVTIASLAYSVATGLDFKIVLTSLLGGYSAVAALTTVKRRRDVLGAGVLVGIVNVAVMLLINFIDDPVTARFDLVGWAFANGLMCGVLTLPILVGFENFFDVVTDIRLLELTGLDNPLLGQLEENAPGSYQHSLNVVKLSEGAARAIGANYLLVRAGAYYHDVGKILKPKYFGENQISVEEKSLHRKLSPHMSAMVIKNHVKAGIDLARQAGLPKRVIDFIPEHQGTTIISWPYHEALLRFENSESTDPVREEDFRYPGPKPQSIETAIVMLADAVEATATSRFTSLSVNEDELRLCVLKTVADKFSDGQFDECDLTLRDLYQIRESFIKTLLSRFHRRLDYPAAPAQSGPAGPSPRRDRAERL